MRFAPPRPFGMKQLREDVFPKKIFLKRVFTGYLLLRRKLPDSLRKTNWMSCMRESENVFVCLKRGIRTLLTDDMAVRDAAKRLGLVAVGSLGIIIKGCKQEIISMMLLSDI
jgi:predicted nucleic acid-binding protein